METFFCFLVSIVVHLHSFMEDKNFFLNKLLSMFRIYGTKTLTMDDIAKEFSISKKTLYQKYKNKEDLIHEVLEFISNEAIDAVKEVQKKYDCPLEVLFVSGSRIDEITCQEKNAFVFQLIKYYPDIFHAHQKSISGKVSVTVKNNYEKGVELGYFRTDVPINLYIKFLISLLFAVDASPIFEDEKDKFSVSIAMKIFYLEAIVTDKGKKRLNELREKFQKTEFLKTI